MTTSRKPAPAPAHADAYNHSIDVALLDGHDSDRFIDATLTHLEAERGRAAQQQEQTRKEDGKAA